MEKRSIPLKVRYNANNIPGTLKEFLSRHNIPKIITPIIDSYTAVGYTG
tara:strand:+ start:22758 stop:22904 length:147 start_codon:yes stop_codon:yes gene_type:complete